MKTAHKTMINEVIAMTEAGLDKDVICRHIHKQVIAYGTAYVPTADELIRMKLAGVDPAVMQELQESAD